MSEKNDVTNMHGAGAAPGQEVIVIDVQSNDPELLQARITNTLAQKPPHRIITTTMAAYGEFPLYFRVLIVIEYL